MKNETTKKMIAIKEIWQTCRIKVEIDGKEHTVNLLMAHQRADGLNSRPVGDRVHFKSLGWFNSNDVRFIELLPWKN